MASEGALDAQHGVLFSPSSRAQADKWINERHGSPRAPPGHKDWKPFSSSLQPLPGLLTSSGPTGSCWLFDLTGLCSLSLCPRTPQEGSISCWWGPASHWVPERMNAVPAFPLKMSGKREALMHFPGSTSRLTWIYPKREFKWLEPWAQAVTFPERPSLRSYVCTFKIGYFLITKVISANSGKIGKS